MSRAKSILTNHKTAKALAVPDFGGAKGGPHLNTGGGGFGAKAPDHFVSRPIASTSPNEQQWEPTTSDPIKQHHRMAGMEN